MVKIPKQHATVSLSAEAMDWIKRGVKIGGNSFSHEVETCILIAKSVNPKFRRQEAADKLREGAEILLDEFDLDADAVLSFVRELTDKKASLDATTVSKA